MRFIGIQVFLIIALLFSCKTKTPVSSIINSVDNNLSTTYYFIRHAEKDTLIDKKNPPLTKKGENRSALWQHYFDTINIAAIYSTQTTRTINTVTPIALDKNIAISNYEPLHLFTEDFLNKTMGKKVLICGHSNTIPALVNKIINKEEYDHIPDTIYNRLYRVTIKNENKTVTVKNINF